MTMKNVEKMMLTIVKNNAGEAWLPGIKFVYLCVRMVRTINLKIKVI